MGTFVIFEKSGSREPSGSIRVRCIGCPSRPPKIPHGASYVPSDSIVTTPSSRKRLTRTMPMPPRHFPAAGGSGLSS